MSGSLILDGSGDAGDAGIFRRQPSRALSLNTGMKSRKKAQKAQKEEVRIRTFSILRGIKGLRSEISQMPNLAPFAPFCGHSNFPF